MIGIDPQFMPDKVAEAKASVRKISKRIVLKMSQYQRAIEMSSMQKLPGASPAGTPPHTHPRTSKKTGKDLPAFPQTIKYKESEKSTRTDPRFVVGPEKHKGRKANWAERIGKTHEFGGETTVEKRVVYRPVRAGEKPITIPIYDGRLWLTNMQAEKQKLFKPKKRGDGNARPPQKVGKPQFVTKDPGTLKTFQFDTHLVKMLPKTRVMFSISHKAKYPKRPFAAPALRKTIAATRQGKFG